MKNVQKTTKQIWTRPLAALLGGWVLLAGSLAQAATLTGVDYTSLPENRMEVRLSFDGEPPEPEGYTIKKPARISLDFSGVELGVDQTHHDLGAGNNTTQSLALVESQGRTRLIINQSRLTNYETAIEDQQVRITLGEQQGDQATFAQESSSESAEQTSQDQQKGGSAPASALQDIDFRRGTDGGGEVVVTLPSRNVPVEVQKEGGNIIARFPGVETPKKLRRRLDVTDFGTPVQFINTEKDGGSTVMTIDPDGDWEYLAYQADNNFTINVKEVTEEDEQGTGDQEFKYTGEKLSLNFQDIEVRSVLQLIADFTDLNLVASDTVTGTITLRLQDVPWDQALDLILKTKGLDKRKVGNVLLVAPAEEIAQREQMELENRKKKQALAPLRTRYIRINYAKAAELRGLIQEEGSLLSERGSITVDERTNTLVVQDTERKLADIQDLVATLDIPVQQVLIEARIVVASDDVSDEIGVRWGGLAFQRKRLAEDGRTMAATGRAAQIRNFGVGVLNDDDVEVEEPHDLAVDLGVQSNNASRFSLGLVGLDSGILQLELSALESEGKSEIVASPKVLTADQQPAIIASGQQIPYEQATNAGATAVEFIEAELRLEATPQITPDGNIIMDIQVNNDSRGEDTAAGPAIDTNRLETTVLVGNGDTVVLGGIFQHSVTRSVTKTPFLGDLPWIGNLFRRKINNDSKQELLVFITPKLVDDAVASR
jgi:type IV pilus assembly protein PilQ